MASRDIGKQKCGPPRCADASARLVCDVFMKHVPPEGSRIKDSRPGHALVRILVFTNSRMQLFALPSADTNRAPHTLDISDHVRSVKIVVKQDPGSVAQPLCIGNRVQLQSKTVRENCRKETPSLQDETESGPLAGSGLVTVL